MSNHLDQVCKEMIPEPVGEVCCRLNVGAEVTQEMLTEALRSILHLTEPHARDAVLAAFLTGVMARHPTAHEVGALLNVAFELDHFKPQSAIKINLPRGRQLISTAGSGKKGWK